MREILHFPPATVFLPFTLHSRALLLLQPESGHFLTFVILCQNWCISIFTGQFNHHEPSNLNIIHTVSTMLHILFTPAHEPWPLCVDRCKSKIQSNTSVIMPYKFFPNYNLVMYWKQVQNSLFSSIISERCSEGFIFPIARLLKLPTVAVRLLNSISINYIKACVALSMCIGMLEILPGPPRLGFV